MIRTIDLRSAPPTDHVAIPRGDAGGLREAKQSPDPHAIAFITCVDEETQYDTYLRYLDALQIPSGYSVEKIGVFGATSMAEGYQRAMEASTARYKIYVHQDVYLVHRGLLPELVRLFKTYPRLGMVGVVGVTRLPISGIWWVKNLRHCYGRLWEYYRPLGLPVSLLGPLNRRRFIFSQFRSFVGDYLPAVVVDGLLLATQYDIAWSNPLGGFMMYDQVQAMEFIKAGLEVGIARQEAIWCIHWGRRQERSPEQGKRRDMELDQKAAGFRKLYSSFIGVQARALYERHQKAAEWSTMVAGNFGDGVTDQQTSPKDIKFPDLARERLGVVIVTFNGREVPIRALRALWPQCEALKEVDYQVVVVDNASTGGTVEAVRREFPQVTVLANASNGLARGFNVGLRHLGFPKYVLVMHDDIEISTGALVRMVSYLRDYQSTAGVSPSLINPDGTAQFQRTAIAELVSRRPSRPKPITFVGTTCAMVRGKVFFDVGLFDERFHSGHEDLDWSLRAKRKGYRFTTLPEARVIRHRSAGSHRNRPAVFADRLLDNLWLVHKHGGRRWAAALYWVQRIQAKWLALRWLNDSEALRQLNEAMTRIEELRRRFREENRRPLLLA